LSGLLVDCITKNLSVGDKERNLLERFFTDLILNKVIHPLN